MNHLDNGEGVGLTVALPILKNLFDVKNELMFIMENPDGSVAVMLDEEHMHSLSSQEQKVLLRSVFLLAIDRLVMEIDDAPDEPLTISPNPLHANCVAAVSMLTDSLGLFDMIVYFGGAARRDISVKEGLIHVLQVVEALREQMSS